MGDLCLASLTIATVHNIGNIIHSGVRQIKVFREGGASVGGVL